MLMKENSISNLRNYSNMDFGWTWLAKQYSLFFLYYSILFSGLLHYLSIWNQQKIYYSNQWYHKVVIVILDLMSSIIIITLIIIQIIQKINHSSEHSRFTKCFISVFICFSLTSWKKALPYCLQWNEHCLTIFNFNKKLTSTRRNRWINQWN